MLKNKIFNIIGSVAKFIGSSDPPNEESLDERPKTPMIDPIMEQTVSYYKRELNEFNHNNNGLMVNSILIREVDDTFIPFDHKLVLINKYNLPGFWEIYSANKDYNNIFIDSRLMVLIMFAVLKYEDDVYIYHVHSKKVINVYRYFAELTGLNNYELSINRIKQFAIFKLLVSHFLECLNIPWCANNLSKNISQFRLNTDVCSKSFVNVLINYIGRERISRDEELKQENVEKVVKLMNKYFSKDMLINGKSCFVEPWKIEGLTIYELYGALTYLKNQERDFSILEFI